MQIYLMSYKLIDMKNEDNKNIDKMSNNEDNSLDIYFSTNDIIRYFDEFNKLNSIYDVNVLFTTHLNNICTTIESEILVINNNKEYDFYYYENTENSQLRQRIEYLIEEGIIDWAVSSSEPQLIMDLQSQLSGNNNNISILIIPFICENKTLGVYIAFTEQKQDKLNVSKIEFIKLLANFAANRINIFFNYNISNSYKEKLLELNDRFVKTLPLTTFGDISFAVLKEISLPLQIIESNINLIESGLGNSLRRMEIIKIQLNSIKETISLLSDISIDSKNTEPEIINIVEMISETVNIISTQIKSKGISIDFTHNNITLFTKAIKPQLEFVLIQIINFFAINPNERNKIFINVTELNNRIIQITIRDESKGYDFNTYEELIESLKSNTSLANFYYNFQTIKNILKLYKGRIESISKPFDGTTFKIQLINQDIDKEK